MPADTEPLTFDEFLQLDPDTVWPDALVAKMLEPHIKAAFFDGFMSPMLTRTLIAKGPRVKAAGFRVPLRFLGVPQPSREEILDIAADLYKRFILDARYK